MIEKTQIEEIEKYMKKLKEQKKILKNKMQKEKIDKKKEQRMRSNGNCKANTLIRVSNGFAKKLDIINEQREKNGLDRISNPKATELIIKHKNSWRPIEQDLIFFNTQIEQEGKIYAQ